MAVKKGPPKRKTLAKLTARLNGFARLPADLLLFSRQHAIGGYRRPGSMNPRKR